MFYIIFENNSLIKRYSTIKKDDPKNKFAD